MNERCGSWSSKYRAEHGDWLGGAMNRNQNIAKWPEWQQEDGSVIDAPESYTFLPQIGSKENSVKNNFFVAWLKNLIFHHSTVFD